MSAQGLDSHFTRMHLLEKRIAEGKQLFAVDRDALGSTVGQ